MKNKNLLYQATRDFLSAYNRLPRKRLGQNFLIDQDALNGIISVAQINADDVVLEIGTGLGVLTAELAEKVKHVTTLDLDQDMIDITKKVLKDKDNVEYIREDFLKWEPTREFTKVVANVPYYITTPIIEKLLCGCVRGKVGRIVLTVQKEVAERIAADPGSKKFGSFTVFVQNRAKTHIAMHIPRKAFYPAPDVDSAVIVLEPYEKPLYDINEKIVRTAFSQKRKMIRSSLKEFNIDFESLGIDPKRRPETLSLEEFAKLSKAVFNY